jgi:soluble lytic murein transglycosylase-like protein
MPDDPWAVVSTKPVASGPAPTIMATASPTASVTPTPTPTATPIPAPTPTPTPAADPWAVVSQQPAPAIPTESIRPTRPAAPVTEQTGDVPSQQPQTAGDFFNYARPAPPALEPIVQAAASKYGVPLAVAHWLGTHESNWDTSAIGQQTSTGTAKGAWQFMDGTAKEMGLADPHDFPAATDAAMKYLRRLADKNGGDWMKAIEAYGTFSSGKPRQDAKLRAGFQGFYYNSTGRTPAGGSGGSDRYAGWDTADEPSDETSEDPEYVPFRDDPGTTRGNILPISRDSAGNYSWAVPDMLRAPVRGVIEGGQEAVGVRPVDDPRARGDIGAALGLGATPAAKLFATGAQKAATTLGNVSLGTAADEMADRPPIPFAKTPEGRAVKLINQRVNEDIAGGDAKVAPLPPYARPEPFDPSATPASPAENYVANLTRMRDSGKQATILDVGGASTEGLAGSRVRDPSTEASATRNFYRERDTGVIDPNAGMVDRSTGAGGRSEADVRQYLHDSPSAYHTTDSLIGERSTGAAPLYEKANRGGSIAPLRDQFHEAEVEAGRAEKQAESDVVAAKSHLNAKLGKQTQTGGNVYSTSAANQDVRDAQIAVREAEAAQAEASRIKEQIAKMRALAQHDIDHDTPGAVWNPRIQRFLDQPEIKSGIRFGFAQERLDAVTENRPFDPTEYALTPDGDVIKVPNMRSLNVAKKGLDVMIAAERGKITPGRLTEYGQTLDKFRREFVAELDKVNPDYRTARELWAGKSASLDAVKFGENFANLKPEEIAVEFSHMSKGEQDFARIGVADALLERIGKTNLSSDEAKAFIKANWNKDQLQPFFKTQEQFVRYLKSVEDERLMKERPGKMTGGSQSVERLQQNQANDLASGVIHGGHSAMHLFSGNVPGFLSSAWRAIRHLAPNQRQAVSDAILRQMRDTQTVPRVVDGKVDFGPPAQNPTMTIRPPTP